MFNFCFTSFNVGGACGAFSLKVRGERLEAGGLFASPSNYHFFTEQAEKIPLVLYEEQILIKNVLHTIHFLRKSVVYIKHFS